MNKFKITLTLRGAATVILLSLTLIACKNKRGKHDAKVKPDKLVVSGPLGSYLEVVDNTYEISDDWAGKLSIKLKTKGAAPDSLLKLKTFELKATLLDESGMPVSGTEDFGLDYRSIDKVKSLLQNTSTEEVVLLTGSLSGYHAEKDADRVKKFSLSSTVKDKQDETTSSTGSSNNSSEVLSNANMDQVLDDYEAYVDDYLKFYKKAKAGDASAMAEYPAIMEKAVNLQKSLDKAKAEKNLSAKQLTRMIKIQGKMATAMTNN